MIRTPYIPTISSFSTIFRLCAVFLFGLIIYSFIQTTNIGDFHPIFVHNASTASPYFLLNLLALVIYSYFFATFKPIYSLLFYLSSNVTVSFLVYFYTTTDGTWTGALLVTLNSLIVFTVYLLYFDWHRKNNDPDSLRIKLFSLQEKMRPHFLFNSLSSVLSLIHTEPDKAEDMLLNLSELLRETMKNEDSRYFSIEDELDLCERYLEIEKIRLGDRLSYSFEIEDDSIYQQSIPKLSLQPLVENSVLHGIQHRQETGLVKIRAFYKDRKTIRVEVLNSLPESNHPSVGNKIAINNLHNRLNLFYNRRIHMDKEIKDNLYQVSVDLPIVLLDE